jgi:hypothetical protein
MAARNHARAETGIAQRLGQPDRQRRLAGAANKDIADHDDRHRQTPGLEDAGTEQGKAQGRQRTKQERQRPQRAGQRAAAQPGAGQGRFEGIVLGHKKKIARRSRTPAVLSEYQSGAGSADIYLLPPVWAAKVNLS